MEKRGYQVAEEGVSSRRGGGIKSQRRGYQVAKEILGYQVAEEGVSSRRGGGIKSQKKFFVRSTSGLFGGENSQNN